MQTRVGTYDIAKLSHHSYICVLPPGARLSRALLVFHFHPVKSFEIYAKKLPPDLWKLRADFGKHRVSSLFIFFLQILLRLERRIYHSCIIKEPQDLCRQSL